MNIECMSINPPSHSVLFGAESEARNMAETVAVAVESDAQGFGGGSYSRRPFPLCGRETSIGLKRNGINLR